MRHEAAGITSNAFPKTIRLGGFDCAASYLHAPGDPKDGVTVAVPIYSLNQVNEERCEWLVPGMLRDKVLALVKTLHQRPRSRLVPLPEYAQAFVEAAEFGQGSLLDVVLKHVRDKTQLDIKRADFKLEQLPPHLLMNFRVNDEHGRQLGTGRNLAALKAELGGQARSAFQALAGLKVVAAQSPSPPPSPAGGRGRFMRLGFSACPAWRGWAFIMRRRRMIRWPSRVRRGWGAMPIATSRLRSRRSQILPR